MGERDPGIGEPADARRDPRHDAERDAGGCERQRLLAAAAEDTRVAALEAQHPVAFPGEPDQPR